MKATRGTKRVCQACATRFYDLARAPIVCPSCGAHHVPEAPVLIAAGGTHAAGFTDKTGWRSRRVKRLADPEAEPDVAPEVAATEDAPDDAPAPNDDVVLDEEPDEADISGLLDPHDMEPGER
jgi:uncharacterized protein (TIGR02300 family)